MPVTRRIFLASPLLLFGCRKKRKPKVEDRSAQISAQQQLDRFVAKLEREGVINAGDLLGGRVVFASKFTRPAYQAYGKNSVLEKVNRSNRPYTYKAYLGPNKMDKIYVVIPDSYISHIQNPKDHSFLRAFLFHEFVHVNDRTDMEMAKKTSSLVLSKYKIDSPKTARRFFLQIGRALSELKANFKMRDFIQKDKSMTNSLQQISDKHLVSWMRAVNNWHLQVLQRYPDAFENVKKDCIEYIRKEFYASSVATQREINQVLSRSNIPQIK